MEARGQALYLAKEDFRRARRLAGLEGARRRLRGAPTTLLPFEEVRRQLQGATEIKRGLQESLLTAIVGRVGRYRDFTRGFLPRSRSAQDRWAEVKVVMTEKGFDPIEAYCVGDAYFVKDGNPRVSIAREMGNDTIPAYVTEIPTSGPFDPAMRPDDLIRQAEHASFLKQMELDRSRPAASTVHHQAEPRLSLQRHDIQATYQLATGAAAKTILQYAENQGSELIVMGGYGHGALQDVVLGRTVDQVLREPRQPRLICR